MTALGVPILEVKGIGKRFTGNWVLQDVAFSIAPGEVVGLMGENGSGKSTLVKILSGVYTPDAGTVAMGGHDLPMPVSHPQESGMAVIHQDLGLVDTMSVADNLGVSTSFGARTFAPISTKRELAICREILDGFGIDVDPRAAVGSLTPAVRSAVAIARSTRVLKQHTENHLLILDEPTAYLGQRDVERVLDLVRSSAAEGAGVIFISHHIAEVVEACDRVLILRDGQLVSSFTRAEADPDKMIAAMLGRSLERFYPAPAGKASEALLTIEGLTGGRVRDVSFALHAGEVIGVTGLVGSGYDEIPYLVAGQTPVDSGEVTFGEQSILGLSIRKLLDLGLAVVPGNRQRDGGWMEGTARENITLLKLSKFFRWPRLRLRAEADEATELMQKFGVRPCTPERSVSAFSGGNQQKIVLAKWLSLAPKVMLLDEPTQGVDAGARRDILDIVADSAHAGNAVAIFSADTEQLAEMCDRVVVMVAGRVRAILPAEEATEARIVSLAQGAA
jgi:ribose transport system ATP-binding protein